MARTLNVKIEGRKVLGREASWGWVLPALAVLVLAAGFFYWGSSSLVAARQSLVSTQQQLAEARQEEARAIEAARRAQMAMVLMREAADQGLEHSAWAERRFNIRQATMSRFAANALLSEMIGSPSRLFGAELFELSVVRRNESLFSDVKDPNSMVQVSVRGSLLFRTTGGAS